MMAGIQDNQITHPLLHQSHHDQSLSLSIRPAHRLGLQFMWDLLPPHGVPEFHHGVTPKTFGWGITNRGTSMDQHARQPETGPARIHPQLQASCGRQPRRSLLLV